MASIFCGIFLFHLFHFVYFQNSLRKAIGKFFSVGITTTLQSLFTGSCGQYIYLRSSYCLHKEIQISEKVCPFLKLIMSFCEWFEVSWSGIDLSYSNLHVVTMRKGTHFKCYLKKLYTLNMMFPSFERTHFD